MDRTASQQAWAVANSRIKSEIKRLPNTQFQGHQYLDPAEIDQQYAWLTASTYRSFRPFMLQSWPYKYWLVLYGFDSYDSLTSPCTFNIRDTNQQWVPVPEGQTVVGYRRQRDRNRDARRHWHHIVGWAGGHFVY